MKKIQLVVLPLTALALTSCMDFSIRLTSYSSAFSYSEESYPSLSASMAEIGEGYYRPSSVNDGISYYEIGKHNGESYAPSKGKLKFLVLPIEFSACPFGESRLKDIRTAFAGTSEETGYWESLKTYYAKSSYGQLDFDFVFADPYVAASTPVEWFQKNKNKEITTGETYADNPEAMAELAMEEAVAEYKRKTGDDAKQFDLDQDGFIDACMMVYSCHDREKRPSGVDSKVYYPEIKNEAYGDLFWAYQYSDVRDPEANVSSPVGNRYFWASYDFFYEGAKEGEGVDAHTLIHETGHILGSDDYYNYGADENSNPSGGLMMMAHNVLDHDAFTKLSYGWVKPYVVTDSATITIRPFATSGECVLLADSWNGTAYDEYVLFELYTPTGLNRLDASIPYGKGRVRGYGYPGVIAYHVDSRLVYGDPDPNGGAFHGKDYLSDEQIKDFKNTSKQLEAKSQYVYTAATNSAQYDSTNIQHKGYELIQLIQSNGRNTLRNGEDAGEKDLFGKGSTFSMSLHHSFFPAFPKLNNGGELPYEVYFEQVNSEYATLKISKKA